MAFDHLLILAIIQGISEFLPVSSSAHLVLLPPFLGFSDQGRMIDIALHMGSLLAVLIYYARDVISMTGGGFDFILGRPTSGRRLFYTLIIATIPLLIAGFLVYVFLPGERGEFLRDPHLIAWASIGFGVLLYIADRSFLVVKQVEHMRVGDALIIGLFQVFALIPGASRAGVTMTAARMLGYERQEAARFSILLSIPAILGAGSLVGWDLYQLSDWSVTHDVVIAIVLSFIAAFLAISGMLAWLKRASFTPFVLYRIALGVVILVFFEG